MSDRFDTPVALLVFRRPEATRQVLHALASVRPRRVLIVADAARSEVAGEPEACHQVRALLGRLPWDCEVSRLYAEENMGCRGRVSSGLDWVFDRVEEAIILEDDCVPDPSFLRFAADLLGRYRDDPRVMAVCGTNFLPEGASPKASYFFSRIGPIWGWATWRCAWRHYDVAMSGWPEFRDSQAMEKAFPVKLDRTFWRKCLDSVYEGRLDTWDFQWTYAMLRREGLAALPSQNLVANIGIGDAATHTSTPDATVVRPARAMPFPLEHPQEIRRDLELDLAQASEMVRARDPRPGLLRHLPHTGIVRAMRQLLGKGRRSR